MVSQTDLETAEKRIQRLRQCYEGLKSEMAKVIVGQDQVVKLLLTGLMSGGHMLVIGVPGLAKTMMYAPTEN